LNPKRRESDPKNERKELTLSLSLSLSLKVRGSDSTRLKVTDKEEVRLDSTDDFCCLAGVSGLESVPVLPT
jgi:hypothetical protein